MIFAALSKNEYHMRTSSTRMWTRQKWNIAHARREKWTQITQIKTVHDIKDKIACCCRHPHRHVDARRDDVCSMFMCHGCYRTFEHTANVQTLRTKEDGRNPFKMKWNEMNSCVRRAINQPSPRNRNVYATANIWNVQWAEMTFCSRAHEAFIHRINDDMKQQQKCNKNATKVILTTNDFRMSVFIIYTQIHVPALTCDGCSCSCCNVFLVCFLYFYLLFSLCHEEGALKPNKAFETSKECFYFCFFFVGIKYLLETTAHAEGQKSDVQCSPRWQTDWHGGTVENFVINLLYGFSRRFFYFSIFSGCRSRLVWVEQDIRKYVWCSRRDNRHHVILIYHAAQAQR